MYSVCTRILLKVASYYDLSVPYVSDGFPKKV